MDAGQVKFDLDVSGVQALTDGDMSAVPKAAFMAMSGRATAYSSQALHAQIALGLTDGQTSRCVGMSSRNAAGTTEGQLWNSSSFIRCIDYASDASYTGQAAFSAFVTGGVEINVSDVCTTNAGKGFMHFLGGDGLQVKLVTADMNTTATTMTVSGVGFRPDAVIAVGAFVASPYHIVGFGVAVRDAGGSIAQANLVHMSAQGIDPLLRVLHRNNALLFSEQITSFNNDGFDITKSTARHSTVAYLCIKTGGGFDYGLLTTTVPTTTGTTSISVNFTPETVIAFGGMASVLNAEHSAVPESECFGVGFAVDTTKQNCAALAEKGTGGSTRTLSVVREDRLFSTENPETGVRGVTRMSAMTSTEIELAHASASGEGEYYTILALRERIGVVGGVVMVI